MNLTLKRTAYRPDGIFSRCTDQNGALVMVTLEHAYQDDSGAWVAKIPAGTWVCQRGAHKLHGMVDTFETFEITGVPGHQGLLFHWGNYNEDSEGCILTGSAEAACSHGADDLMVTNSRAAFNTFMGLQQGASMFLLTVIE